MTEMLHLAKTEWIVLNSVLAHGTEGAGTSDIEKETRLHRVTVYRTCTKLKRKNILQKKNKMAKYQVTGKVYGEPSLLPFSLGMAAVSEMLKWKNISVTNRFCNTKISKKIMDKSRHKTKLTPVDYKQMNELTLFEFANRLGALILYFLISAMSPKKLKLVIKGMKKEIETGESDEMAMKWIENAIKPARILQEFAKIGIIAKGRSNQSSYILDEYNSNKLMTAFKNVYGDIYDKLECIKKESTERIEFYRYPKSISKI